ncbi:MAG: hypothetical protein ABI663_11025 [Chryseolinea sp.]
MNNLLNDLYNEILGKTWNIESVINKFDAMTRTLRLRESNMVEVEQMMKNTTHIEQLIEKIGQRLREIGVTLKSFDELDRQIATYYEEN